MINCAPDRRKAGCGLGSLADSLMFSSSISKSISEKIFSGAKKTPLGGDAEGGFEYKFVQ
jgi:hypothetical protein